MGNSDSADEKRLVEEKQQEDRKRNIEPTPYYSATWDITKKVEEEKKKKEKK